MSGCSAKLGIHEFRARLHHGPLKVSNVVEAGVSDAFHILPYILSAPTLISVMARTNSCLWAGAHFLLRASHLEPELCLLFSA